MLFAKVAQFCRNLASKNIPDSTSSSVVDLEKVSSNPSLDFPNIQHKLSTLRLLFAHFGQVAQLCNIVAEGPTVLTFSAALTLFLATTDAVCSLIIFSWFLCSFGIFVRKKTIVSTSLPTIASELGATQSEYTWVGVAYMLTQTACQPLHGRISDLVGRKVCRYSYHTTVPIICLFCFRIFYTRV
jgi:hypothetical protein